MTARVRIYRPTPTGRDHVTGVQSKSRRVIIAVPAALHPYGGWSAADWVHGVCGPGTRPGSGRTPGGTPVVTVARPHFRRVVEAAALRWGEASVTADVTDTHACGRLCWEAVSDDCSCSCFGSNHGGLDWTRGWIQVGEDWLVAHKKKRLTYRVTSEIVKAERGQRAAALEVTP